MPHIKLLVSYAGRKEGNYGYIYQATNWEYLGYFISNGFWYVNGEERHLSTLWSRYKRYGNQNLSFTNALCEMYEDVRKTKTKQFIYIMRLDKTLTPASPLLPYPKPDNEFPIKVEEYIYKQNDEIFNNFIPREKELIEYYYVKDTKLFTNATLKRRGEYEPYKPNSVAVYDAGGNLEATFDSVKNINMPGYLENGIRSSIHNNTCYKNKYFRFYEDEPDDTIEVPYICIIDEIPFNSFAEAGRYMNMSRQAIHNASKRKSKMIGTKSVIWIDENIK
jgi:hypothetical protein